MLCVFRQVLVLRLILVNSKKAAFGTTVPKERVFESECVYGSGRVRVLGSLPAIHGTPSQEQLPEALISLISDQTLHNGAGVAPPPALDKSLAINKLSHCSFCYRQFFQRLYIIRQ